MLVRDPQVIADEMAEQGMSARRLAALCGWRSHTYLQRVLRGEVRSMRAERAHMVAYWLGAPLDRFFVTQVTTTSGHENQRKAS